jgi:hypothetical protein
MKLKWCACFVFFLALGLFPKISIAQIYKPVNALLIEQADTFAAMYLRSLGDTFRKQSLEIYLDLVKG